MGNAILWRVQITRMNRNDSARMRFDGSFRFISYPICSMFNALCPQVHCRASFRFLDGFISMSYKCRYLRRLKIGECKILMKKKSKEKLFRLYLWNDNNVWVLFDKMKTIRAMCVCVDKCVELLQLLCGAFSGRFEWCVWKISPLFPQFGTHSHMFNTCGKYSIHRRCVQSGDKTSGILIRKWSLQFPRIRQQMWYYFRFLLLPAMSNALRSSLRNNCSKYILIRKLRQAFDSEIGTIYFLGQHFTYIFTLLTGNKCQTIYFVWEKKTCSQQKKRNDRFVLLIE